MAFINNFTTNFAGQSGIHPQILRLETSGNYGDITAPGFLNSAAGSGVQFSTKDMFLVKYAGGMQFFTIVESDGIYTMQVYEAGSNNFEFEAIFVSAAPGASNDNPGNQLGYPKSTLQAALNAANDSDVQNPCVICLDSSVFTENLLLSPMKNIQVFMPNATLNADGGPAITLENTGELYTISIIAEAININSSSSQLLSLSGAQSECILTTNYASGDVYNEGDIALNISTLNDSIITNQSSGVIYLNVSASNNVIIANNSGEILGNIRDNGSTQLIYGDNYFAEKIYFHQDVKNEIIGRVILPGDSVSTIVYNNASSAQYTLPSSSEQGIPIGTEVEFVQLGLGAVQFLAGSGATIVSSEGASVQTNGIASKAVAQKLSATLWIVSGDITASA